MLSELSTEEEGDDEEEGSSDEFTDSIEEDDTSSERNVNSIQVKTLVALLQGIIV